MVQPNGARRRVGTQATGSRNCSISRATVAGSSKIATWPMPASHCSYAVGMAARKRDYLQAKAAGDLARVQAKFDTPILIIGDVNDEPGDTSVLTNLQASSELDRVVGKTNRITKFEAEVATYRGDDTGCTTPAGPSSRPRTFGTFFIESTNSGEHFANRYQILDNLVASRGLLLPGGITLDPATVQIY